MSGMIDKIIHGNNVPVMMGFPDEYIDLIVTSPPYDNLRIYEGYSLNVPAMIQEFMRIVKPGGVVVWVVGDATIKGSETGTSFRQALMFIDAGFNLHDTMFWYKPNPMPTDPKCYRYYNSVEYVFVFSKGKPKTCNYIKEKSIHGGIQFPVNKTALQRKCNGEKRADRIRAREQLTVNEYKIKSNMWVYSIGKSICSDKASGLHPAMFPEQLAADHITSWSNEGDLVLDPMCGSGTTCKMAKRLKRHWTGIDTSAKYCLLARNRVRKEIRNG